MVEEGSSGLAFLSLFTWIWRTEIMKVALDNQKLQYSGRIDDSDPKRPQFIFPATSLGFRFFGRTATLKVQNKRVYWKNYVGAIVDGEQKTFELKDEGMTELLLVDGEEREHEVLFFKRMDSCHELILEELTLSEGSQLLEMPQKPKRKIEVYGDSVSAGEVSEAEEYRGQVDPEHNGEYSNSWYSYGWITARKLNAQIHDIAQGGIALLDGTGWFCDPEFLGMESVWDKVHYNPEISPMTTWDFSRYTPDVVIVAIGQNDNHPEDYMKEDMECEKAIRWRTHYKRWIESIRKTYPKAVILLTTTILCHDKNWDRSIERICEELKDDKIFHFLYSKNGCGTPGHIRGSEAEEMAQELSQYIENLDQ